MFLSVRVWLTWTAATTSPYTIKASTICGSRQYRKNKKKLLANLSLSLSVSLLALVEVNKDEQRPKPHSP